MTDQMEIFTWAMEGLDLAGLTQFRQQSEESVGDVESGEEPPRPPL
jgi:hypothetical protein